MSKYDMEQLIKTVERRCSLPISQIQLTEDDIVSFANDELQDSLVPLIIRSQQNYFLKNVDLIPDNTGIIPIPSEAVGCILVYVMATGPNQSFIKLPYLDLGTISEYGNGFGFGIAGGYNGYGTGGFYTEGDDIHLYPSTLLNTYNQELRLYYYGKPLDLIEPDFYGQIVSVDHNTNTVNLSNVPSNWSIDTEVNIVDDQPNFKTLLDTTVVSIVGSDVVLADTTGISVNDYISLKGTSAVPQVLANAFSYLCQLTVVKCMESIKDNSGLQNASASAERLKQDLVGLISNRVQGQPQKIVNNNWFTGWNGGRWR